MHFYTYKLSYRIKNIITNYFYKIKLKFFKLFIFHL